MTASAFRLYTLGELEQLRSVGEVRPALTRRPMTYGSRRDVQLSGNGGVVEAARAERTDDRGKICER